MGVSDGWVEIGDRVFVRRYAFFDQNIGLVLGRAEALVIDTRSTYAQAREIQEHVRELTDSPIGVVIDTHGHFDHAFGNAIFRPATIWGHERCVTFMVRTGEARKRTIAVEEPGLADDLAEIVIDPPDRVFATHARVEVGGREVVLRYLGRGHTDHDVVDRGSRRRTSSSPATSSRTAMSRSSAMRTRSSGPTRSRRSRSAWPRTAGWRCPATATMAVGRSSMPTWRR